jgi:dTDP-4-amino-4,6-dideoxy-D-galactose acyltransferase
MAEVATFLQWDTDFFGKRIGRVEGHTLNGRRVSEIERWVGDHDIDCLYFLADDESQTVRMAEARAFHLVDIRMTFGQSAEQIDADTMQDARPGRDSDRETLLPVAADSYVDSRFFRDPRFDDDQCAELYRTWLDKSFDDYADEVIVLDVDDTPAGFVTCHLRDEGTIGVIGLVGVDSRARGRGVGRRVVADALRWFRGQGVDRVEVVTQGRNIAAQRLYQASGFRTAEVRLWYHRWFSV